jgi:hypothetical protein
MQNTEKIRFLILLKLIRSEIFPLYCTFSTYILEYCTLVRLRLCGERKFAHPLGNSIPYRHATPHTVEQFASYILYHCCCITMKLFKITAIFLTVSSLILMVNLHISDHKFHFIHKNEINHRQITLIRQYSNIMQTLFIYHGKFLMLLLG